MGQDVQEWLSKIREKWPLQNLSDMDCWLTISADQQNLLGSFFNTLTQFKKTACLLKYALHFSGHQALKVQIY